jgi:hypothetical protein
MGALHGRSVPALPETYTVRRSRLRFPAIRAHLVPDFCGAVTIACVAKSLRPLVSIKQAGLDPSPEPIFLPRGDLSVRTARLLRSESTACTDQTDEAKDSDSAGSNPAVRGCRRKKGRDQP